MFVHFVYQVLFCGDLLWRVLACPTQLTWFFIIILIGPKVPWYIPNLTTEGTCLPFWILWVTKYPFLCVCQKVLPHLGIEPRTFRLQGGYSTKWGIGTAGNSVPRMFCWSAIVWVNNLIVCYVWNLKWPSVEGCVISNC